MEAGVYSYQEERTYRAGKQGASAVRWLFRIVRGSLIWFLAIALGLLALKGNVQGFANKEWWHKTGVVYLLWGYLNFIIVFGLVHFIIPFGLKNKRYLYMILMTYALIIVVGLIKFYFVSLPRFDYVNTSYYKNEDPRFPVYFTFMQYIMKTVVTGTFVSILAYGWGLAINWYQGEKLRRELENKSLAAELSFLRMQVNPHFLFNSLNSIYSLALKKSDRTPEAVLRLSEMMRYMLYEHEDDMHRVDLAKEIEYLKNYVSLQKIRFNHQYVDFLMEGDLNNRKIAPLLLIPFIENGYKHGLLTDPQHPLKIYLLIDGDKLIFQVRNKKNLDYKDQSGGIGLENVEKRLRLLYPGKHQLTINDGSEFYQSDLVLFLS